MTSAPVRRGGLLPVRVDEDGTGKVHGPVHGPPVERRLPGRPADAELPADVEQDRRDTVRQDGHG